MIKGGVYFIGKLIFSVVAIASLIIQPISCEKIVAIQDNLFVYGNSSSS
jgi:hypothetical protein